VLGRDDGGLLFENRIPDLFEDVLPVERKKESIRVAREALAAFLKALEIAVPIPYYAILVADGDHMGRAIQRQTTAGAHQALSRALDGFARRVGEIVERPPHRGELIYAGGDDVLAFVPLHNALACAKALKEEFGTSLQGFPVGGENGGGLPLSPTLSVGIGISHFMEPMGRALALARRAEKLAKTSRDALAVIVDKRSGPALETHGRWGTADMDLAAFVKMHVQDWVPDGAAYELRDLARLLPDPRKPPAPEGPALVELVRAETCRILKRKQPQHGEKQKIHQDHLDRLLQVEKDHGLRALSERLLIARLIAEAALQADPTLPGENS
jgi:CRISPR-associated protein Cmr2